MNLIIKMGDLVLLLVELFFSINIIHPKACPYFCLRIGCREAFYRDRRDRDIRNQVLRLRSRRARQEPVPVARESVHKTRGPISVAGAVIHEVRGCSCC